METLARTGRGGWQDTEINKLREAVHKAGGNGEPLCGVFERVGESLGRKPNSVRNFYYASLKREELDNVPRAAPFETFSQEEVRSLVKEVLRARAKGVSVRACVFAMASGNRKQMLRYQNKYRSILKTRPALIRELMDELAADGEETFDPYAAQMRQAKPLHESITSSIQNSSDPALLGLLYGLDTLLARSGFMEPEPLKAACAPLIQCVKDFLGLPADGRKQELTGFCDALSEHIGAVENAIGA